MLDTHFKYRENINFLSTLFHYLIALQLKRLEVIVKEMRNDNIIYKFSR